MVENTHKALEDNHQDLLTNWKHAAQDRPTETVAKILQKLAEYNTALEENNVGVPNREEGIHHNSSTSESKRSDSLISFKQNGKRWDSVQKRRRKPFKYRTPTHNAIQLACLNNDREMVSFEFSMHC